MYARTIKITLLGLAVVAVVALPVSSAWAQTMSPNSPSSGQLVEKPKEWDGKTVEFTGEAIGEAMVRDDYAWIHLNDDAYYLENVEEGAKLGGYNSGMAVYLPAQLAGEITTFGDYKHEGDVVTVKGTFNAACAEHGGDMDIHADQLVVKIPGHPVVDVVKPWKVGLAIVLSLLAVLLYVLQRRGEIARVLGHKASRS